MVQCQDKNNFPWGQEKCLKGWLCTHIVLCLDSRIHIKSWVWTHTPVTPVPWEGKVRRGRLRFAGLWPSSRFGERLCFKAIRQNLGGGHLTPSSGHHTRMGVHLHVHPTLFSHAHTYRDGRRGGRDNSSCYPEGARWAAGELRAQWLGWPFL